MCPSEVENMFYVGEEPWHGLGKKLDDPPTTEVAIKEAGLDWTVRAEPLFLNDGRTAPAQATVRESDNSILGAVGPDYSVLQNLDAFKWFDPFLEVGSAALHTAGSLRNGKRVWILAEIKSDPLVVVPQSNDEVKKFILLSNSHDGSLAVRVGYTPVRVVCANTLAMSHTNGASKLIRVKHVGNVKETLENVREIMQVVDQEFVATGKQYQFLASKGCSESDLRKFVRIVFKVDPEKKESRIEGKVIPLFEHGFGQDLPGVKGTWWAAYNAVNEYFNHQRSRTQDVRLDNLWFGDSAKMNKEALDLALKLAA